MNSIINISKFYYLNFVLFFFLAIFIGRIAGSPPSYLAMYSLSILLIYNNFHDYKISTPKIVKSLLTFFIIYFLYSIFLTTHILSTVQYFIMWLLNISVIYFILKLKNIERFLDFYLYFIVIASLLGMFLHFGGIFDSANPFDAFNKNAYIFLVMVSIAIALQKNKKAILFLILVSSIFIYSRTLYVMLISACLFYVFSKIQIKILFYLIFTTVILGIILLNLSENLFFMERIEHAFSLINALYNFSQNSDITIGKELGDKRRFYVIIVNLDLLINTFPFGTGMGIDNYLSQIDPKHSTYLPVFGRAHNYYISYFAEMGLVFFLLFTYILYKPLFLNSNIYYKSLYFGMLIGIATNEYVTSPYFWILFALIYRIYYEKRSLKNV